VTNPQDDTIVKATSYKFLLNIYPLDIVTGDDGEEIAPPGGFTWTPPSTFVTVSDNKSIEQ